MTTWSSKPASCDRSRSERLSVTRDRDDPQRGILAGLAQAARHFVAVHARQTDVEKHELWLEGRNRGERRGAVVNDARGATECLERLAEHLPPRRGCRRRPGRDSDRRDGLHAVPGDAALGTATVGSARGSRITNSLPRPIPALCADTVPPCRLTTVSHDRQPDPEAALRLDRGLLAPCTKRSKIRGSSSGAIPMPESHTLTIASSLVRRRA